ncbi:hypothetical protein MKK67_15550 [Methylobacterium sp. J-072]|uniref:hypothetical protein n=1 Tax=Methylobacterium sp. J-072 TaxID=2836651 RepID=UPI001FBA4B08|nr:hypothetical protein [Methylobacterium sp. J-072]MCJ2093895.1 hypothetical protein [Methylobacterium sp. J-072]
MIEPNQTAFIVKVARRDEDAPDNLLTVFYAVIADNPDSGVQIVKEAVKAGAEVTLTEVRLSQATAQAIDLMPGYARAL